MPLPALKEEQLLLVAPNQGEVLLAALNQAQLPQAGAEVDVAPLELDARINASQRIRQQDFLTTHLNLRTRE